MIKVIIVDDSATARSALNLALDRDPQIIVVGEAATGEKALKLINNLKPDLVTMDVFLKNEHGLDVVEQIMATSPRPVLVITGADLRHSELGYEAIAAGALDILPKLPAPTHPDYEDQRYQLVRLVKTLSKVPVVHHFRSRRKKKRRPARSTYPAQSPTVPPPAGASRVLCLGASTGGPPIVCGLLEKLPAPFPLPIVFCQHISPGFVAGFAAWLNQTTGHEIILTEVPTKIEPGKVYLPKDDHHLKFVAYNLITSTKKIDGVIQRPSIDIMFQTAAKYLKKKAIGVIFTGMGNDGSGGMAMLREAGAITIAQSPDSCAIDSMPRSAIKNKSAKHVLAPDQIAEFLTREVLAEEFLF